MTKNDQGLVDGFMVLCGVGVGMTFGPLAIHARFSQPNDRVAIVVGLNLFFRTFGGTVGLAQCSAVLNAKVRSIILGLVTSGKFSPNELQQLAALGGTIDSLTDITNLPADLANAVRDAFRDGVRWAFISLLPWTSIAAIMVLFLSKIPDADLKKKQLTQTQTAEVQDENTGGAERSSDNVATQAPRQEEKKVRIYGPISLIIYLYKKQKAKRQRANMNKDTEKTPEVGTRTV